MRSRAPLAALGVLYAGVVIWATLSPLPWATEGAEEAFGILSPQAWTDVDAWTSGRPLEIVLNVLMFLPIGLAVGLLMRSTTARALLPVALTVAIELAQIPLEDRISHPRDLLANALGAASGVALAALVRRGLSTATARRLDPHARVPRSGTPAA